MQRSRSKDPNWNHLVDTEAVTWRSAAVHWGESLDVDKYKWTVFGYKRISWNNSYTISTSVDKSNSNKFFVSI